MLSAAAVLLATATQQQGVRAQEEPPVIDAAATPQLQPPPPPPPPPAPAGVPMKSLSDDILAYTFEYPTATASGKQLPMVLSRRPERYSSAAPLTADARQRIVCELADLMDSVTVSLTVGPPSAFLAKSSPDQWNARQVAEQVLIDRSTGRMTTGQRVSLNSVEEASVQRGEDGTLYFFFEHVAQGSPTMRTIARETYRHALAVTAVRPGENGTPFLYTLNMSCPQDLWEDAQGGFARGVASFKLLQPGPNYVAPDKQPWRFF
ncbi:hypothetical protein D9Q98_009025 [Chlorella vulgaris]|uniref:PsbP C-terminal domain-containing protein n=1 Tax=Chlorella vulgaris TaxID=3077 RepID=A0A9D4YTH4_CHLVU|nr:hypothetical protein D9Q98_009025 [Chlorella vulgaris]